MLMNLVFNQGLLVNQVSNYGQLRDITKPFKQFLSPQHPFTWNPDLDAKFIESKKLIVDAICKGSGNI